MPKFRLFFAATFLIGGVVVGWLLELLGTLGAGPLVFWIESFFAVGLMASLPVSLLARRVLAVMAYLSLFFAVFYLHHMGLPLINIGNLAILLIAFFYLPSWVSLTFLEI